MNSKNRDALFSISYGPFHFFFFWHKIRLMECRIKAKHLKRQLWAVISNTISTTPILQIDHFTGWKGIRRWPDRRSETMFSSWLRKSGEGGRRFRRRRRVECRWRQQLSIAMSHKHNAHRVPKFTKHWKNSSRGYCHAIYMLTRLRRQSQVSLRVFFFLFSFLFFTSGLAVGGFTAGRVVFGSPPTPLLDPTLCLNIAGIHGPPSGHVSADLWPSPTSSRRICAK